MIEGPQPDGLQSVRWFAGAVRGSLPRQQSRQPHLEVETVDVIMKD